MSSVMHEPGFMETDTLFGVNFQPLQADSKADRLAMHAAIPTETSSEALLQSLREEYEREVLTGFSATPYENAVFGEGNPGADIVFIGEAPGAEEDRTGRPFVGRAGRKLDEMIAAMGLERAQVYICNIVKLRPPGNRTPTADEIDRDSPWLLRQISIIKPRVIVTLGSPATRFVLGTSQGITKLRGTWSQYRVDDLVIDVMPTFHPAYLLRNYTRTTRQQVWHDIQAVMQRLDAS